nr:CsbD family protein [Nocardia sp. BMG111209]
MTEHEKSGIREGVEGIVEDVKGRGKEVAGAALHNEELRREGVAQQDRAEAQRETARHEALAEAERARARADEARQHAHQQNR